MVEPQELEEKLKQMYHAVELDPSFAEAVGKLAADTNELCHFTVLKYTAVGKRAETLMRTLQQADKIDETETRGKWLATILTTTGPIVGPEEMLKNIAEGRTGTLLYGMEADYVALDKTVTTKPLLWLPLGLEALALTNIIHGAEPHLMYFPAITVAAKGDAKTQDYRTALTVSEHHAVENAFVNNVRTLCKASGVQLEILTEILVSNEYVDFASLRKLFIANETKRKEFWEEVPKAVRDLARWSRLKALRAEYGNNALAAWSDSRLCDDQESEQSVLQRTLLEHIHKHGNTNTSLEELFRWSEENPLAANILGYTLPEAMAYMCLPLTHKIALAAAGDKVGNESMRRFRNPHFWKALGKPQGVAPIAYWDEHRPSPGAYRQEPAHYKFFVDRQRPNNSCDIRVGDGADKIKQRFMALPVTIRAQDLEYFFVPYWLAKGMAKGILGTENYFDAHRQARIKPMDKEMVDTLIMASERFKGEME